MFDIALTLEQSPQTIPTNSLNLNIIKYYHILVAYTIRPNNNNNNNNNPICKAPECQKTSVAHLAP